MAKTEQLSDVASIGRRIDWLLAAASEVPRDGSERRTVVVGALVDAARVEAEELARR